MFQILTNPNIDFMSRRNVLLGVSTALVVASVVVLVAVGLNLGIDFTGGTELQVKYAARPDLSAVRGALKDAGMDNNVVTTIGDPADHEVYIRLGSTGEEAEEDQTTRVLGVLRTALGVEADPQRDLNVVDERGAVSLLATAPGLTSAESSELADAIVERRKDVALFQSYDDLRSVPGMTGEVVEYLRANSDLGPLALRSQSYVGPTIGSELMQKAIFAIVGSLIGMLIYIWIRFQLIWGFAAVVALFHDTMIVLGLFVVFGQEMSLPVVAAFLTLVGYSVNDTVVVFDRIRENLKHRRAPDLASTINLSINQTLSRTVITSGLTWIVVAGLFVFGGTALKPFSFVLTVGVIVGTYSSIWIASPILMLWQRRLERGASAGSAAASARRTTA